MQGKKARTGERRMRETARYEGRGNLLASVTIGGCLAAFGGLVTALTPGILDDFDIETVVANLPPAVAEGFGLEAIGSPGGFIALELYQYVWLVGLGSYLAYSAAGSIAGDAQAGRLDMVLAAPLSRRGLLAGKFLAYLVPVLVVNAIVGGVVIGVNAAVGAGIEPAWLVAVHLLSVPYLLVCCAIGVTASVFADRRSQAEGVAVGTVVGTFVLSTLLGGTALGGLTRLTPASYYDPLAILTTGEYDLLGAGVLLAATVGLLAVAAAGFERADIA
mgnify:FL=1